jgi:hypothetical protein
MNCVKEHQVKENLYLIKTVKELEKIVMVINKQVFHAIKLKFLCCQLADSQQQKGLGKVAISVKV